MDKIDIRYTDKIIKKVESSVPKKIKEKYFTETDVAYKYGAVRFDNNKLSAIYVYPNGYEISDSWYTILFKFDVIEDNLVFKYVYDFIEDGENNTFIEGRYDDELNLESKYTHFDERVPVKGGKIYCAKEKEGKNVNYIFCDKPKKFPNKLKFLEEEGIIINNSEDKNLCWYGEKQNSDVVYLVIANYS